MGRQLGLFVAMGLVSACASTDVSAPIGEGTSASESEASSSSDTESSSTEEPPDESQGESTGESETGETQTQTETETESESGPPPEDLPPPECEPLIEDSVLIDENTSMAELQSLACVEEITGDLQILDTSVEDLSFLSSLQRVGGELRLSGNDELANLSGLDALTEVGAELRIWNNEGLIDLTGLGSLSAIHQLSVSSNGALVSLDGLEGELHLHASEPDDQRVRIAIDYNDSLVSLDGLGALTSVTSELPLTLSISDNQTLGGDLSGLAPWISNDHQLRLWVSNNHLDSLAGLEALSSAQSIALYGPAGDFVSLVGLQNLSTVSERLAIGECLCVGGEVNSECEVDYGLELLMSLDGLESLTEVGELVIWGNRVLTDVSALSGLMSAQSVQIFDNPMLSEDAVNQVLLGVEIAGNTHVNHNGTGDMPVCGFIPQ